MRLPRGCWTALKSALVLVLMCSAWVAFAPTQFGGQVSYVIVAGASMEPTFFRDDLVLVRERSHYEVGEVVTYRDPRVGPVIHRIVEEENGRYVLQGDNNAWLDPHEPRPADIIGGYWLHVPKLGYWLGQAIDPVMLAILAFILVLMIMRSGSDDPQKHSLSLRRWLRRFGSWLASLGSEGIEGLFFLLGAMALVGLILALAAFSKPSTREVFVDTPYALHGSFSYHGEAPPGIYDNGGLFTGDPAFLTVTDAIEVDFTFELESEPIQAVAGSHHLLLELSNDYGWRRTFELAPEASFDRDSFSVSGVVDLAQIQAYIEELQDRTEVIRGEYELAVVPVVNLDAQIADQSLRTEFAPHLNFELRDKVLQLDPQTELVTSQPKAVFTQEGMLREIQLEPETFSILTITMQVRTARQMAVALLSISLPGMIVLGVGLMHAVQEGKETEIRLRFGAMLVEVQEPVVEKRDKVIQVSNIDDLARFAEKAGQMILVFDDDQGRGYYVREGQSIYRYWHPLEANGSEEES